MAGGPIRDSVINRHCWIKWLNVKNECIFSKSYHQEDYIKCKSQLHFITLNFALSKKQDLFILAFN